MSDNNRSPENDLIDNLQKELLTLHSENQELRTSLQQIREIMSETNGRIQISSASVQTAVSSLLSKDFFWDISSQHEFLEIINESIDSISKQAYLISLFFRIVTDRIEIKYGFYDIDEIFAAIAENLKSSNLHKPSEFRIEDGINSVRADFNYLTNALALLICSFNDAMPEQTIIVKAFEMPRGWNITIESCPLPLTILTKELFSSNYLIETHSKDKYASIALKLFLCTKLLQLQNISLSTQDKENNTADIILFIPSSESKPMDNGGNNLQ